MKQDNKKLYESIMTSVAKEVKKALNESPDNYSHVDTKNDWEPEYVKLRKEISAASNDLCRAKKRIALKYGFKDDWGLQRAIDLLHLIPTHYKEGRQRFIEDVNHWKNEDFENFIKLEEE